ncbi:hypothetical protein AVEN_144955-1 [Araneus ventricosus]|uniref:Uncharacterized protein n=1 Tax=Araneus ventricosus TaxID=182803 RepID=A0A4Y2KLI7_ARAVE|nr:hypothetical protein AVEN_144955-1 [Araneus ventricosus]
MAQCTEWKTGPAESPNMSTTQRQFSSDFGIGDGFSSDKLQMVRSDTIQMVWGDNLQMVRSDAIQMVWSDMLQMVWCDTLQIVWSYLTVNV